MQDFSAVVHRLGQKETRKIPVAPCTFNVSDSAFQSGSLNPVTEYRSSPEEAEWRCRAGFLARRAASCYPLAKSVKRR